MLAHGVRRVIVISSLAEERHLESAVERGMAVMSYDRRATPGLPSAVGHVTPGSFFVNAGRGELVDEAALQAALDGAALDVGMAPKQMPSPTLARHARVVAAPHIGGLTPPGHRAPDAGDRRADGRAAARRDAARRRQRA